MKKCILFITYINESSIQTRHQFFHFAQIYIADGKRDVAGFLLELNMVLILQYGYRYLFGLYINY